MIIRALIIDDEPLARLGVRHLLASQPDICVLAECQNGAQAIRSIRAERPDLVFLDIAMPGASGFDVLEAVPPEDMPVVVFVTAHDRYALEAFEAHAIDYLLKPVEEARFRVALDRVRGILSYRGRSVWPARLQALLSELRSPPRYRQRLMIRASGRMYFVTMADVDWIEASGNYARLHVGPEHHVLRETLVNLERELDPDRFCRIHRSTIINLDRVHEIHPESRGDQVVVLRNGTRLALSARHREAMEQRLGRPR